MAEYLPAAARDGLPQTGPVPKAKTESRESSKKAKKEKESEPSTKGTKRAPEAKHEARHGDGDAGPQAGEGASLREKMTVPAFKRPAAAPSSVSVSSAAAAQEWEPLPEPPASMFEAVGSCKVAPAIIRLSGPRFAHEGTCTTFLLNKFAKCIAVLVSQLLLPQL